MLAEVSPVVLTGAVFLAPALVRRAHPGTAARVTSVLLVSAGVAVTAWVFLFAMSGLLLATDNERESLLFKFIVANASPPLAVSLLAWGLLAYGATVATRTARSLLRCWRRPARGGTVIVDDDDLFAFALPGPAPEVVISRGLVQELRSDELQAVIAHERAHLASRHHLYVLVVALSTAGCPWLRWPVGEWRFLLERWADEDAARVLGDRRVVARAISRAAVSRHAQWQPRQWQPLQFGGHHTTRRVRALLDDRPCRAARLEHFAIAATTTVAPVMAAAAMHLNHAAILFG